MRTQGADKRAQRGDATAQGRGHPVPEELLGGGPIAVVPEMLELVLEHPRPVDASIGVPETIEEAAVSLGPMFGVPAEQPAQPFDRLPSLRVERPPLFLPDLIHGLVQRLDEMERSMTSVTWRQWSVIAPI